MLALYFALFVAYWVAIWRVVRMPNSAQLAAGIFAVACLFRGISLPSAPMHEIDIYRYIWDGAVVTEGVSPYRFAPQQVQEAFYAGNASDPAMRRLVERLATSDSLSYSLHQIHYGQYPSPYPMVSQAVFALAAQVTPDLTSRHGRLVLMKLLLVLFDLATLAVVILLLREVDLHVGWSLAYGWCPLVMKEIANSGHLDSIAVFLTTVAIWLLVKTVPAASTRWFSIALTGVALALAIGAKLYPLVLLPLFAAIWYRRRGWKALSVGLGATALTAAVLLYPLFGEAQPSVAEIAPPTAEPQAAGQLNTPAGSATEAHDSGAGIRTFLKHWEMNDLVFMFVLENLRQQNEVALEQRPWFVWTSDTWSRSVVSWWARLRQPGSGDAPRALHNLPFTTAELRTASFSLARLITGGVFALIACLLAWSAAGKDDPCSWCRAAMLTLAWFWLTCPTQNPWYWCWVLPLLPFARYRTWYVVAAVTMLYYLRFWLTAHYPDPGALGTPYSGAFVFYFVIVWIEFLPVLLALLWEWVLDVRRRRPAVAK